MKDHRKCERIRMALAEVGLDPDRMICGVDVCCLGAGLGDGDEGLSMDEIDRLTDRAIALVNGEDPR